MMTDLGNERNRLQETIETVVIPIEIQVLESPLDQTVSNSQGSHLHLHSGKVISSKCNLNINNFKRPLKALFFFFGYFDLHHR